MPKKHNTETVLVVDDEASVREVASQVIERAGYRVLQAENGDVGLRLMREDKVSLVLLDLVMPGRDGWAVLEEMKSDSELRAIPVVLFTACDEPGYREKALCMGAADYLSKPFRAASLVKAIVRLLESAQNITIKSHSPATSVARLCRQV